jgi:hypothetical protein
MAWRKRGRPRKPDAKRRKTTTAERRPIADLGTDQLRFRKLHVVNGSGVPIELFDHFRISTRSISRRWLCESHWPKPRQKMPASWPGCGRACP